MNGKLKILSSMAIFGTVGIFVRFIPMASAAIAFCRGVMGCIFLLILMAIIGKKPNLTAIRRNGWILALSGAAIGINWILLFEAYRHTTVAIATICYYLAPAFVTLGSPLVGVRFRCISGQSKRQSFRCYTGCGCCHFLRICHFDE